MEVMSNLQISKIVSSKWPPGVNTHQPYIHYTLPQSQSSLDVLTSIRDLE